MSIARVQDLGASAEAIRHHYDVGNAFYGLWLDPETMSYTAALWGESDAPDALGRAQERKIDHHARAARIERGSRVLDVGCGWGGAMRRFVDHHGAAHAVGLTLSDAQARWIGEKRLPQITVRVESWADHAPSSAYDAIVSIEAFEAFAKLRLPAEDKLRVYRTFFEHCHAWLRPGGRMSLQTIAYGNSGPEDFADFIASEIFPESDLPKLREIAEAIERRFEVETVVNDRDHYARTLRRWRERLHASRDAAVREVGEPVVERYEEYLRLSEYMFSAGTCDLLRIGLRRIDHPRPTRQS